MKAQGMQFSLLVAVTLAGLIRCADLSAQQTNNYELRAVPAPAAGVSLDGELDEWDLSGEILTCYDISGLLDTHSARTALMYDGEYLYLSFRFRDRTPLVNRVDPANKPSSGWRSDAIQLRLWSDHHKPKIGPPDGARITHVDCYYYTVEGRPSAFVTFHDMSRGKEGFEARIEEAIGRGVDAVFAPDPDGNGYTLEMRVSWKLLRRAGRAYTAGDTLRMGIEYFWGDETAGIDFPEHRFADLVNRDHPKRTFFWTSHPAWGEVHFLDSGGLDPSPSIVQLGEAARLVEEEYRTSGPVAIEYELPADGYSTLVIEKPDGTRVRNLISEYPRRKGANVDRWDGTDDFGNLVSPGEYRVRGLYHGELDILYQFAYGSPGNPTWMTGDGTGGWLSDHERPVSVATDGQWVYLSSYTAESGNCVIGVDETGQKRWGSANWDGGMLAVHGDALYMLSGGGHPPLREEEIILHKLALREFRLVPFADGKSDHVIHRYPEDREVRPRQWPGKHVADRSFDAAWLQHEALGLAAAGDRLYASLFYEEEVLAIDPEHGTVVDRIPLAAPAGLAGTRSGALYAISGAKVTRLEDGEFVDFVTDGLAAPVGLATDGHGNVYVSDWGGAMDVKVFSPEGELLSTVGATGGRPLSGPYDGSGMFRPFGIAIDEGGRLWVAEFDYTPKRVSVWDAGGELVREYLGPTWYGATETNVNTLDPTQAFSLGTTLDLDWEEGTWQVSGTLWRPTHPDALVGPHTETLVLETIEHEGRQLLVASKNRFIVIAELEEGQARPLAAFGNADMAFLRGQAPLPETVANALWDDPAHLAWAREEFPAVFRGALEHHRARPWHRLVREARATGRPMRYQFVWTDGNGDGLVQGSELTTFSPEEAGGMDIFSGWRLAHDADLTLYPQSREGRDTVVWRLPVRSWNEWGAPVYDLEDATLVCVDQHIGTGPTFCNSVWIDARGNILLNQHPLTMVDADGNRLWTYPNPWPGVHGSHTAPRERRGRLIGPLKVIGSVDLDGVGEVFCFSGNMGQAFLMTTDGLYLGSLFRDLRGAPEARPTRPERGVSFKRVTAGGEWFGGEFFRNRLDDEVYLGARGGHDSQALHRITGLETTRRLPEQRIEFSGDDYARAEQMLATRARPEADAAPRTLVIEPIQVAAAAAPSEADFPGEEQAWATWTHSADRFARGTWSYDADHLYVCFADVRDRTPMVNGGAMVDRLFKTGDAAVLELRTAPDESAKQVMEGDLRLLFSVFEGDPVAVLYDYRSPGAGDPHVFSSVTSTTVDRIEVLEDARIRIDRTAGSYTLTAAVPLRDLGFRPRPNATHAGDLGIVYSDVEGRHNELRMFWANRATGLVSDLALEAAIAPGRWGSFRISE